MARKLAIDGTGLFWLLIWSMTMGVGQVVSKQVNQGLHPLFHAGMRSLCALIPIIALTYFRGKKIDFFDGSLGPGLLAGTFFSLEFTCLFMALDFTTVSRVVLFFYTMPLWISLYAHFFLPGERLSGVRAFGLVVAFLGLSFALREGVIAKQEPMAIWGDLLALLSAFLWTAMVVVIRSTKLSRSTPEMQLIYQLLVSSALLVPLSFFADEQVRNLSNTVYLLFAVQVFVMVGFGFTLYFWLLSTYPASSMSSFGFLVPLFGTLASHLFLDEPLNQSILISLALVSLGVLLVNTRPKKVKYVVNEKSAS